MTVSNSGLAASNAFQSGLQAYRVASEEFAASAQKLSGERSPINAADGSLTNNSAKNSLNYTAHSTAIGLISSELQAKSATDVIKTADGMLGTIIDLFV